MEEKKLVINYAEYDSLEELPVEAKRLMESAMESAHKAYAPYSKFHVGAAVLLADGSVVQGSNQENVAYPSGLCAGRKRFVELLYIFDELGVVVVPNIL